MSAKKSFKDTNPALRFISVPSEPDVELDAPDALTELAPTFAPTLAELSPRLLADTSETKSRRVQLLLKPSLFNRLKARADSEHISVNELVHRLLES